MSGSTTTNAPVSASRHSVATDPPAAVSVVSRAPGPAERDPARFYARRRWFDNLLRFGTPVLLLLGWQVLSSLEVLEPRYFPPPADIGRAGWDLVQSGVLQEQLWISLKRLILGFVLGSVTGIVVGLALGAVRPLRVAFDPIISALYTVPKLALLPLLFLIFGLGDMPKVLLIAMSIFFIVSISTTASVMEVSKTYSEPVRSFHATGLKKLRHVTLPAALPDIFVSLRIAAGAAVLVQVAIEFLQGGTGIGYLIWNSWQLFLADRMYVGIVTIALVGVIFQAVVKAIGGMLAPWARSRDD